VPPSFHCFHYALVLHFLVRDSYPLVNKSQHEARRFLPKDIRELLFRIMSKHWRPLCSRARQNTIAMPPKKRHIHMLQMETNCPELYTDGPSQAAGALDHNTIDNNILSHHILQSANPNTSTEAHVAGGSTTGPEGLPEQQLPQIETFASNTTTADLIPQSLQQVPEDSQDLHLEIEDYNDQQQDSKEEIKAQKSWHIFARKMSTSGSSKRT
jgi:hypothetical protein